MGFFKLKTKNNTLTVQMFYVIYKITPRSTPRKGWSTYVVRGRECFVGLSILLAYGLGYHHHRGRCLGGAKTICSQTSQGFWLRQARQLLILLIKLRL